MAMSFYSGNNAIDGLLGHRVLGIEIDHNEQRYLRFHTDKGDLCYYAWGECCSESWFYHVLGVDCLLDQQVTKCTVSIMGDIEDELVRQDYDKLYKITITTERGYCDIEFRNSSNGYYGGWVEQVEDIPEDVLMTPITRDYTAGLSDYKPQPHAGHIVVR